MSELIHPGEKRFGARSAGRQAKSERTKAEIVEAAFEFLWSRPFREMTVNTLMANTSVSRPAFYQYFQDVHELMETLLVTLEQEILVGAEPWFTGAGDPVALLNRSLGELVRVCYRRGPFLKAIADAAPTDRRLEDAWNQFLNRFDQAVSARIAADQSLGLIEEFDPMPFAVVANRMDAYAFVHAFGRRPRNRPEPVLEAITRVWIPALYGERWLATGSSELVRPGPTAQDSAARPA